MAAIFGEGNIFGKLQRLHSLDTLWVENFDEITLLQNQNGRHFWGGENFLKIANITVGRKFRQNRSISHG